MKKIDRTEHVTDICQEINKLASKDLRIGQMFEILRNKNGGDLFNIENKKLLELFKNVYK